MIDKNELLKRQTYHWFWGVRTHSEHQPNDIFSKINELSDEQIAEIRADQLRIASMFIFVRFFYWLFNWDNYVVNAHLLKAHNWLFDDTSGDIMNGGILDTMSNYFEDCFNAMMPNFFDVMTGWMENVDYIDASVATEADVVDPSNHPKIETSRSSGFRLGASPYSEDHKQTITITFDMLSDLKVLGLQHSIGMSLSERELKKAYYQKALANHPDKNQGSAQAAEKFRMITESFNALKEKIDRNVNVDSRLFSYKPYTFDALSRELDRMNREVDDVISDYREMGQSYREIGQSYREIGQSYRQISQDCEEMIIFFEHRLAIARQQGEEIEARKRQEAASQMETHEGIDAEHQVENDQPMTLVPIDVSPYSELNYVVRRNQPQSQSIYFFNLPHQQKKKEASQQESALMICDKPANI